METDRKKKPGRFVFAGIAWGITMLLFMEVIYPLLDNETLEPGRVFKGAIVWLVGGLIFGYLMKVILGRG